MLNGVLVLSEERRLFCLVSDDPFALTPTSDSHDVTRKFQLQWPCQILISTELTREVHETRELLMLYTNDPSSTLQSYLIS
jgi:hypothetical protein